MIFSDSKTARPGSGQMVPTDRRDWLVSGWLALITVLIYLPVVSHDFILADDTSYVTENPMVQNGLSWAGLKWAFIGWHASNWHPLTWVSHQLDCQLFGLQAGAHHLVNVLFHAVNAVLLFQLWRRLTQAIWPSALVAALFAWHPLHVESVAWVAERKDVLSTFFGLLALLAYGRYVTKSKVQGQRSKVCLGMSLAAFALGLLAKPMLVTLPFVLLLLDYWPLRRFTEGRRLLAEGWRLGWEKWPFFLLTALSCLCTFLAQRQEAVVSLRQLPVGLRVENALMATVAYLGKTLWPVDLCVFYPLPQHFSAGEIVFSAGILAAVSVLAWRWRQHGYFLTGWLWFLGMLVPVIGLVQVGEQAMADRYMYLPAVGLFVAAAFGLAEAQGRWKLPAWPLALAALLMLGVCVAVTEHQLAFWRNTETLFTRAVTVTKNNGAAQMILGVVYKREGRMVEAQEHYQAAMDSFALIMVPAKGGGKQPLAAQMQLMFGQAAEQKGNAEDAMDHYREAVRLDPNYAEAHDRLGDLLAGAGQPGEALAHYQMVAKLRPETPQGHEKLGTQLAKLGRFDEARGEYQAAAQLAPADAQLKYLLGRAWLAGGHSAEAIAAFRDALRLNPQDGPSLIYLARVLASDETSQNRNGTEAVALAEQANSLTGGTQPMVLSALAMADAETGRFEEARKTAQTAIQLAANSGPETLSKLQAQLRLYEANQPFRETFTNPAAAH